MLLWLAIAAVLIASVLCVDEGAPPETLINAAAAAVVIDRLRAEILRRIRRNIQNRQQWQGKLSAWKPPPKEPPRVSTAEKKRTVSASVAPKPKKARIDRNDRDPDRPFQDAWLQDDEFKDWLEIDADGYVRCGACIRCDKNTNLGLQGGKPVSDPWKRTQLTQHCGDKHKDAIRQRNEDREAARNLKTSRLNALKSVCSALGVIIRLVYWLCLEGVAMLKLASLYDMVRNLPVVPSSVKLLPPMYSNAARCREFVMALSTAIKQELWADISNSPFVSVLIDESTDISTSENLIIYFIYVKDGLAVASYISLVHATAVDAESITESLLTFFAENGLNTNKIIGFCSDGASVMTGCHNGVGVRLQRVNPYMQCVHCIAHRLALCCADAADDVDYPEMAETVVNNISAFFNRSGK